MQRKVRRTVTLDADVAAEFERGETGLSAEINEVLVDEMRKRQSRRALRELMAELERERGPVDPERVEYYKQFL